MDPVQSTASKAILDTVPDAAEQKSESSRLGGRILRACRPICCSVQTDEGAEPDKKPLEKSTSKPTPDTPASTDADTSPPANEQQGGHQTGSVDSGAGRFAGDPGS